MNRLPPDSRLQPGAIVRTNCEIVIDLGDPEPITVPSGSVGTVRYPVYTGVIVAFEYYSGPIGVPLRTLDLLIPAVPQFSLFDGRDDPEPSTPFDGAA